MRPYATSRCVSFSGITALALIPEEAAANTLRGCCEYLKRLLVNMSKALQVGDGGINALEQALAHGHNTSLLFLRITGTPTSIP